MSCCLAGADVGITTNSRFVRRLPPSNTLMSTAQMLSEVLADLGLDLRLGGRGQAQHRRRALVLGSLTDEAAHIAVIGGGSRAPTSRGKCASSEHPGADLALGPGRCALTRFEAVRGNQQDRCVAEAHPLKRFCPLGQRQQPVNGDTRGNPQAVGGLPLGRP